MRKLKLFFALCALLAGVGVTQAQETPANDGVYYLYNESSGLFLTRGNNWGTQAVARPVGLPWKVSIADGKYTLRMYDLTVAGSTNGFGDNSYSDNGSPITFTPAGTADDGFTLQNGSNYITCPAASGDISLSTTASAWQFLTQAQYNAVLAAKVTAQENAIAELKGITIPSGQTLNDVVTDANNWTVSATVNDGVPTSSTWTATKNTNRGGNTNWGTSYGTEMYQCGNAHYKRTISGLKEGVYKVTVRGMKRMGNNATCVTMGNAGYPVSDSYLSANGYIIRMKAWYEDKASDSNPNSTGDFVNIVNNGGYTTEGFVYVGSDGNLVLDASSEAYWGGCWFLFNGISYTYYNNEVSDEDAAALIATIPTAKMSDAAQSALDAAKSAFLDDQTIANYNALVAAIDAAAPSIAEYATIASGTVPTNSDAGWAISTTNGELACNTWSTEGNTDGSGMTTPFIQDWVANGSTLGAGRLYYTFSKLNPGETYVVTALVRVFNEAGTGVTGGSFFAGDNSKSLADFGAPCTGDFATKGMFATLSCAGTVDANGQLQFGIDVADGSPLNWIAIKNVTIAEGTGDVPTAIDLDNTSLSLTTASTAQLTATITPSTADDKTIVWTSSNTAVATVSGGYIVAVAPGTATITAQAYAGNNVKASCTVTVSDAAAPAYYSTEIANGTDYYIVNAATGMYLGGGNSWGTQASLIEHGIPFTAALSDGKYTLDSHTYNNASSHFFSGTYVDGTATDLYITSLGNGKFSISTADGSAFVSAWAATTVVSNAATDANSTLAQWYFLSKNDRDKALTAATANNPVDATYYVKQADISRNLSAGAYNVNAWSQYDVGGTQDNANYTGQVYDTTVDNYQTIENIPNGTYEVTVQAFTSGSDVKFYANDQKVDVKANDSGATSCSAAAALFAQRRYSNTVTVTVTDRTLKIGFEGDCSNAKWLCYDKVEMVMTGYTPVTGIAAQDTEVEVGQEVNIGGTTPAEASFNAVTYTSANEAIATVDAEGKVTGVAVGQTTITVTANEMESFTKTITVTVSAVAPTSLTLSSDAIALNETTQTATLTVSGATPEGANTTVSWTSSDETVATVSAAGVVTAVLPGKATITATSVVAPNVTASATVTVTYPESTVPETYFVNNGAERTVYTLGSNLVKNGSFEYPNPVYGWTTGTGSVNAMSTDNFNIVTEGAADGNQYLQAKESKGGADAKSINTSWAIEDGKTYVFSYQIKANKECTTDLGYIGVSLSNTKGSENSSKKFDTPAYGTQWKTVTYAFTNTDNYKYLVLNARWMGSAQSFDNIYLAEATYTLEGNVDYATAAIPTANIGTGAFQYSQEAIDAAKTLVQGTATVQQVQAAYDAVTTINEPQDGQLFTVSQANGEWTYKSNNVTYTINNEAMTYIAGGRTDAGNYNIQYKEAANANLAQAFTFTKVSGNNYTMSQIDADGVARYISTGVPYSGNTAQIRTTTDATKALAVTVIPTTTEGVWNLRNTEANQYIGGQDAGVYTVNSHINFSIVEAQKPSITINTTAAGYGTTMLPFAVTEIPQGVAVYACAAVDGNSLTLESVQSMEANKPYIIEGAWNETLTGDAQGTQLRYTEGLLTGTYTDIDAPNGSYVLQNHNGKVGFYRVDTSVATPKVRANRAYLTAPASNARAAFFFGNETTGIATVEALTRGEAEIFDANGIRQQRLVKGLNIVRTRDGKTQKIMVK